MLNQSDIVPLFGLSDFANTIVVICIGIIGSIIAIFLIPRIFCPLFLKIKAIIRKGYKNAYIQYEPNFFAKNRILRRSIFLLLLDLGFLVILIPLIDPALFLPENLGPEYYEGLGIPPEYSLALLLTLTSLLTPLVIGLWSIAWTMEDAGLMHYSLDTKPGKELYEIEPIHLNYSNILKGYAGISSILFLIQVAIAYASITAEHRITDIFVTFLVPFFTIFLSIPAYIIYAKFFGPKNYLKKNLKRIKRISEQDIAEEK